MRYRLCRENCQEEKKTEKKCGSYRALQIKESHLGIVERRKIFCVLVRKLRVIDRWNTKVYHQQYDNYNTAFRLHCSELSVTLLAIPI